MTCEPQDCLRVERLRHAKQGCIANSVISVAALPDRLFRINKFVNPYVKFFLSSYCFKIA